MMKKSIFLVILTPLLSLSQMTDTTCIKSRWIALKPNETNKDIFSLDPQFDVNLVLLHVIKRLVETGKLDIYEQDQNAFGKAGWDKIYYEVELKRKPEDPESVEYNYFFENGIQSSLPLINSEGYDSITFKNDGAFYFVYETPKIYTINTLSLEEIRIKEDRIFNKEKNEFEFVTVGIGFYSQIGLDRSGKEKFWISLEELFAVLNDKEKYSWYTAIVNQNYQGFQYMQLSCYDDKIRY